MNFERLSFGTVCSVPKGTANTKDYDDYTESQFKNMYNADTGSSTVHKVMHSNGTNYASINDILKQTISSTNAIKVLDENNTIKKNPDSSWSGASRKYFEDDDGRDGYKYEFSGGSYSPYSGALYSSAAMVTCSAAPGTISDSNGAVIVVSGSNLSVTITDKVTGHQSGPYHPSYVTVNYTAASRTYRDFYTSDGGASDAYVKVYSYDYPSTKYMASNVRYDKYIYIPSDAHETPGTFLMASNTSNAQYLAFDLDDDTDWDA